MESFIRTTRALNDDIRAHARADDFSFTRTFSALPVKTQRSILGRVRTYVFRRDNPKHEHDFATFRIDDYAAFFHIVYISRETRARMTARASVDTRKVARKIIVGPCSDL